MNPLFTPKFTMEAKQVMWIVVAWMLIGVAISCYEYSVLSSPQVYAHSVRFRDLLISQLIATFLAGMIGGTFTVRYFQNWIRTIPYGRALLMIVIVYSLISFVVSYAAGGYFFTQRMDKSVFSGEVQKAILDFVFGPEYLRIYFLWLFILIATIIALLVNDKYGPGVFKDFLLGKYFHPRKEERIFMFLDLRSSTTIAEQLGEQRYFDFLKTVFIDVTPAILYSKGEIYQYVGDEIIISWRMKNGLDNANCLQCFQAVQMALNDKRKGYAETYGIIPEFKAGLHYGHVMAGEIGVIKKDITFLGDVLNTTARIQEQCNQLGADILFSKYLSEKLGLPQIGFIPIEMGNIFLRGKQEKIILFTV